MDHNSALKIFSVKARGEVILLLIAELPYLLILETHSSMALIHQLMPSQECMSYTLAKKKKINPH